MFTRILRAFTSKRFQLQLIPPIFVVFVLAPLFEIKLFLFLTLIVLIANTVETLTKGQVAVFLGGVFAFAFINTPYWQVFPDPKLKLIVLLSLLLAGGIWSYTSASECRTKRISLPLLPLIILTGLIVAVNSSPLGTDIAWRGDESFHIYMLLHLSKYIRDFYSSDPLLTLFTVIYAALAISVFIYVILIRVHKIKPSKLTTILLIPITGITILFPVLFFFYHDLPLGWNTETLTLWNMVRWPFFEKWINFLFLFPYFSTDIRLYRIVPLICSILLAWYLYIKFDNRFHNHIISVLCSFAFITVPLVYNFSSILYLEMPIVLLLTYCVFNIQDLLFADSHILVRKPVWYALLLLSFLKETVVILLVLFLISRLFIQLTRHKITVKLIRSELLLSILIFFPLLLYLLLRGYYIDVRSYTPQLTILLDPKNYLTVVEALWNQMGAVFPLSAAGLLVLFLKKERGVIFGLLALSVGILIFFMIDGQLYLGYSRYNLFLIPAFFYMAYRFFTEVDKLFLYLMLAVLFVGNYFLNPIMSDGVHINNWGCPNTDGAEYYYPYERVIQYLKSEKNITSMMIVGQYFPHWGIQFYQLKYNFYPRILTQQFNGNQPEGVLSFDGRRFTAEDEQKYLQEFFTDCLNPGSESATVDAIVYHSVNNIDLNMNATYCGKFRIRKKMRNSLNSLYVLEP